MVSNIFKHEITKFYLLFLIAIILSYFIAPFIGTLFFILILFLFLFSRNDAYFWLALIYCFIDAPGGLFSQLDPVHHLPNFPISGIGFSEIFIGVVTIKLLRKGIIWQKQYYSTAFKIFIISLFFMVIATLSYGISFSKLFFTLRHMIPFVFILAIPLIIKNEREYRSFFYLIFCFLFFVLLVQIIQIIIGIKPAYLIGGKEIYVRADIIKDVDSYQSVLNESIRPVYSTGIWIISLFGSMYYIWKDKIEGVRRKLPHITFYATILSIFLSGTRGWILASIFLLIMFLVITQGNPLRMLQKLVLPTVLLLVLFYVIPSLSYQADQIFMRFEIVEQILSDKDLGNTDVKRIDERSPRVMAKFNESPVMGFGFSDEYYEYRDPHVANQTLLLNGGIIGFSLFMFALIMILFKLLTHSVRQNIMRYRKIHLIGIIFLISLLMVHSTTAMIFSFTTDLSTGFALSLFLVFSNRLYYQYNSIN